MALKTLVKAGSISNLSDARYCSGMGVDFLGFRCIQGQPGYISPGTYQEIRGWISGPLIVAEIYGIGSGEELRSVMENYHPDYLELSPAEYAAVGHAITIPFILAVSETAQLPVMSAKPAYILLPEAQTDFTGFAAEYEILLRVTSVTEVQGAVSRSGISGISVEGGTEISPGLKNFDELAEILEALEVE